jgi:hypothetical protein
MSVFPQELAPQQVLISKEEHAGIGIGESRNLCIRHRRFACNTQKYSFTMFLVIVPILFSQLVLIADC